MTGQSREMTPPEYGLAIFSELCVEIRKTRPLISGWLESMVPVDILLGDNLVLRARGPEFSLAKESLKRPGNFAFLQDALHDLDKSVGLVILDSFEPPPLYY